MVHEQNILKLTLRIKEQQLQEVRLQLQATYKQKESAATNFDYYNSLINDGLSRLEITELLSLHIANGIEESSALAFIIGATARLIANTGSPFAFTYGGREIGASYNDYALWFQSLASISRGISSSVAIHAQFRRREQEWKHMKAIHEIDLARIRLEVAAAEIRQTIAERDLEIHEKNIAQTREQYEFIRDKFTNLGLYTWMADYLQRLYRQAYQLAYAMALKAEQALQYERDEVPAIIQNAWEPTRAGLLAGEALQVQLNELEKAYLEANTREYELTKHISLAQFAPLALLQLKQNGECELEIPELWFDMDFPGHYYRRIKSVSLSIPCIAGPYTTIACTLTQISHTIRKDTSLIGGKYEQIENREHSLQSVATSSAQRDSGLFELNFRDERYLPFEYAGAISTWKIELNNEFRQFDFNTISDVILHINYTARDGGADFKTAANKSVRNFLSGIAGEAKSNGLYQVYDLKREFPNQWHAFLYPPNNTSDQVLLLENLRDRLPYFTKGFKQMEVSHIEMVALSPSPEVGSLLATTSGNFVAEMIASDTWKIQIRFNGEGDIKSLPPDTTEELFLIIKYTVS